MSLLFVKKRSKFIKLQYTLFFFLIVVLIQTSTVKASDDITTVDISSLGSFEASFLAVKKVGFMKGQHLIGQVAYMPGENYSVTLPFDAQRISYYVKNGSLVNQGDTIALVEGYDVHHFIDASKSAITLLKIQEEHYQRNKLYFKRNIITSSQWIEITKSYFEAKLNLEHIQHQMSFLHIDENEDVTIISPKSGIIQIPSLDSIRVSGDLAFDIIDKRLIKVNVPLLLASNLSYFEVTPACSLNIHSIDKIADKYHQVFWLEPATTNCQFSLGQSIKVTPVQTVDGYKIAKSAVFEFKDQNFIAIKVNAALNLLPINLLGTSEGEYIFTSKENIEGKQVLISSVSILQGSLLSLGAE